jgi:hypothetical protein
VLSNKIQMSGRLSINFPRMRRVSLMNISSTL